MAISSFQRPAASSLEGVAVSQVSGEFSVDLSAGNTFFLDFDSTVLGSLTLDIQLVGQAAKGGLGQNDMVFDLVSEVSSDIQENDLILVAVAEPTTSGLSTPTGYTSIAGSTGNDVYDIRVQTFYKIMGPTPDTSLTVPFITTAEGTAVIVSVLRNVDISNPLDVAPVTQSTTNTMKPDPPAITTITDGSAVVAVGAGVARNLEFQYPFAESIGNFVSVTGTRDNNEMVASLGQGLELIANTGTFNPQPFNLSGPDDGDFSAAAITMAFRPATQSGVTDSLDINFVNIPNETKEFSVISSVPATISNFLNKNELLLNWDSGISQATPLPTSVFLGGGIAESLITYNGVVYTNTSQAQTYEKPMIQKTEFIKYSQVWTAPEDVTSVEILLCGGGGSGNDQSSPGGGGGGSAIEDVVLVNPGQSYTVVIGAGGAQTSLTVGNPGNASSFGGLLYVQGGGAGSTGGPGLSAGLGGRGGYFGSTTGSLINPHGEGLRGYGRGGLVSDDDYPGQSGAPNSGQGASPGNSGQGQSFPGGSGICIIKYWTAT